MTTKAATSVVHSTVLWGRLGPKRSTWLTPLAHHHAMTIAASRAIARPPHQESLHEL
jgi:hypothetical protein